MLSSDTTTYRLDRFFDPAVRANARLLLRSTEFERYQFYLDNGDDAIQDTFPLVPGAACCFLRLHQGQERTVRFTARGSYRLVAGASGGWLLDPANPDSPAYWFPQPPILRTQDEMGHILQERHVSLAGLNVTPDDMSVDLRIPANWQLDWVFWRFDAGARRLVAGLEQPLNVEKRPYFLWGSKVNFTLPAGIYHYLVHGQVYTNDFVWPRNWKFHSELDAYGLYLALAGLELATDKELYGLIRRQVLYSVIAAQAEDGGWRQGEWTDLMESHYRLHNSAMLMLAAGLEESGDTTIRAALSKAAAFLSTCTDKTEIGHWFLHDSLENSVASMEEMRRQTNTPWIPSHTLGKSATNKLILNTHLDAIVALERYRDATGDGQYTDLIASARGAARTLLAMRPAETLYRLIYKAIHLTLLPKDQAVRLPLPMRILKRLTWMHITPRMHRVKRIFPRIAMPGGLIERHIAPMHYDINYHPVNVMDLARYWRRFPDEDLAAIVDEAVKAVSDSGLLRYWSEAGNRQFAVVEWADALYHLCTLNQEPSLRRHLADTMLYIHDAGLGLPPALLGCDTEVVNHSRHTPCPSPTDSRLMVANLSHGPDIEILVVNPADSDLELAFEGQVPYSLAWSDAIGLKIPAADSILIGRRGWILGRATG